jgi:ribose/xylose/arabinose/galactoside ABC-type transport system permease subunit
MLEIKTKFIDFKQRKNSTFKNKHLYDSCQDRQKAIIGLGLAIVGEFLCLGAISCAWISQKPIFNLSASSPFSTNSPLLSNYVFGLLALGLLTLILAFNVYNLFGKKRKKISYFIASLGTLFIILASGLLLANHTQEQQGWGYLSVMTWGGGYIAMTFSDLTSKEQKHLHYLLKIASLILMLAGLVLAAAG